MNFVTNIISNAVGGFVEAGTRTAGGFAGDALIRAGDLIENAGRGVGTSIEGAATSYGTKVGGQNVVNTGKKAVTAGKSAGVQRSYTSPASMTTVKKTATPIGANKYPTGKAPTTPLGGSKYPGSTRSVSSVPTAKPATPKKSPLASAPKPYPGTTSNLDTSKPKPYPGTTTYPSKTKSSAGTPGATKAYPGTNTLPGSGKKTAVKAGKPKAMSMSYAPPTKAGDTFKSHLPEIKI